VQDLLAIQLTFVNTFQRELSLRLTFPSLEPLSFELRYEEADFKDQTGILAFL